MFPRQIWHSFKQPIHPVKIAFFIVFRIWEGRNLHLHYGRKKQKTDFNSSVVFLAKNAKLPIYSIVDLIVLCCFSRVRIQFFRARKARKITSTFQNGWGFSAPFFESNHNSTSKMSFMFMPCFGHKLSSISRPDLFIQFDWHHFDHAWSAACY